jgi:hypothetical protein
LAIAHLNPHSLLAAGYFEIESFLGQQRTTAPAINAAIGETINPRKNALIPAIELVFG